MSHVESANKPREHFAMFKDVGIAVCLIQSIHISVDSDNNIQIMGQLWYFRPQVILHTTLEQLRRFLTTGLDAFNKGVKELYIVSTAALGKQS